MATHVLAKYALECVEDEIKLEESPPCILPFI